MTERQQIALESPCGRAFFTTLSLFKRDHSGRPGLRSILTVNK